MSLGGSFLKTLLIGLAGLANVGLILLFAAGYASAFLPPAWFWWTWLPASLLPFWAAGLLLATAIHLLRGRWGYVALHAVLLALFLTRASLPWPSPPTSPDAASVLTVMSFNYTPFDRSVDQRSLLRNELGALADTHTPDLIAMQSIRVFQRRGQLVFSDQLDTLATAGYHAEPEQNEASYLDTRVPLFQRSGPVLHQEPIVLSSQEDIERHVMRSELEWRGQPIVVYNVHLRSFERSHALNLLARGRYRTAFRELVAVYRRDVLQRTHEARELRALLDEESQPTLLVGDLNASPFNWEYRHVRGTWLDPAAALGGNWRFTWHTRFPLARIDHVLASSHWQPHAMQVDTTRISDHYPLIVSLYLREDT